MPQQHSLFDQLQGITVFRSNMPKLITQLRNGEIDLDELIELTLHKHRQTAFHAAWLMEDTLTRHADEFIEYWPKIVQCGAAATNPSCHRHFMKVYSHFTNPMATARVKAMILTTDLGSVTEQCFDKLTDPGAKVAVKVAAAETLCHLSQHYTWIAPELTTQLNLLMQNGSPAIMSAGRRLLNILSKLKA